MRADFMRACSEMTGDALFLIEVYGRARTVSRLCYVPTRRTSSAVTSAMLRAPKSAMSRSTSWRSKPVPRPARRRSYAACCRSLTRRARRVSIRDRRATRRRRRHRPTAATMARSGRLFAGTIIVRHAPCRHLAEGLRPRRLIQLTGFTGARRIPIDIQAAENSVAGHGPSILVRNGSHPWSGISVATLVSRYACPPGNAG
jgi:hypothetical protein